ncbi:hypothetical protein [Gordonia paraffinivorans]|uniref:Phospholipase A2 n=2 Tax=Gordonia paraffinivorans TaxID=175628 RepID=A0ABQ0IJ70_9ACTN|nr:hypothetical protein [Gordonia paraffinivorans]MCD2143858.1 hypothetical protein [Gordonia paraffinivorans]GAC83638.1 hypothetical protein GP2_013_01150 [Gordonia paraffinivorans NBRC 108238]VFA81144.1 Uncharacterised protein [Gordonia paraffinivorans]
MRAAIAAATLFVIVVGQWMSTAQAVAGDLGPDGTAGPSPRDAGNPYAQVVLTMIGPNPAHALEVLPASFEPSMGYTPLVEDGFPINPDGDCSSPVPLPDRFTPLCRTHDLGYDVLRAAARTGHPLDAWARLSLDRMLIDRMHRSCTDPACHAAAQAARIGLAWNTWRQFGGPPVAGETIPRLVSTTVERLFTDSSLTQENS